MGSRTKSSKISDDARNGSHETKPSHGRTSGPTRRSTKGQWTSEEDEVLRIAVQRFQGKNWKKIAECFKDRTDVQCLHRWQKVLNPELVKGPWSKEEDNLITELVKKYGPKKWSTIAQHLPGRIGKQCRERWHNHLNPNIVKEAWTQTEELVLIRAHQVYGNKWAELTKFLPGRSDNAIKNHWNSSVKKKLGMYLASGLLSEFEISHLISHQGQSSASSSSKPQQSDDTFVKLEVLSEYSQDTGVVYLSQSKEASIKHLREECMVSEQSLRSETFSREDLQVDSNKPPDISVLDIGEVPQLLLPSVHNSDCCEGISFPLEPSVPLGSPTSLDSHIRYCPSESTPDGDGNTENTDNLHNNSATVQLQEKLASQSGYVPPDVLGNTFSHSAGNASLVVTRNHPEQFGYSSHENAEERTHEDFIYPQGSNSSSPEDEFYKMKNMPRLVPANDFVLEPSNDSRCSPSKEAEIKRDDEQEARTLCDDEPHFPTLDVPFFNCDLIHSGSDMHQDYSPFGIRKLLMSSMTPLSIWDSPSRDDSSEAILTSAARTFSRTPSILKKRHRDLLSPLAEKRDEKKLEGPSKQEPISCLTNHFSRLNMKLCESMCKEGPLPVSPEKRNLEASSTGKENVLPSCHQIDDGVSRSLVISECSKSSKELKGSECLNMITFNAAVIDSRNAVSKAKDIIGVLAEHDVNALRISSNDKTGIKSDREIDLREPQNGACKRLDSASKQLILSSSEKSRLSSVCSPCTGTKMGDTNLLLPTPSSCPGQKLERVCGGTISESNGVYIGTPLRRSLESPSAWKSPWFLNTFVPGPKIHTDTTLEDIGYFLTGDCSYDALEMMKELGEHTAATYNAQEALCIVAPDTIPKEKCNANESQMVERRILDFSECFSPQTGKGNFH